MSRFGLRSSQQIVEVAHQLYGEAPKADSVRTLSLSIESGDNFVGFREKQPSQRRPAGSRPRRPWSGAAPRTARPTRTRPSAAADVPPPTTMTSQSAP